MTNTVIASQNLKKEAKTLIKKFHTLKESIDNIIADLLKDPYCGEAYGQKIYKVRLKDKAKAGAKAVDFGYYSQLASPSTSGHPTVRFHYKYPHKQNAIAYLSATC